MPENKGQKTDPEATQMDWAKMVAQFWAPLMPDWTGMFTPTGSGTQTAANGRMDQALRSSASLWQAMFGASATPSGMDNVMRAAQMAPDIAFGLGQSCLQTFMQFQQQVQSWLSNRAAGAASLDTQDLDKEFIKQWSETYRDELSRYLKVPQLGLGRFYQERALAVLDAFNLLEARIAEFTHMLYLPMEQSFIRLQQKMVEMTDAGSVDENPKTYYNLWIKLLEAQYMQLFQEPEYTATLSRTLEALFNFTDARQRLINDLLKMAGIPTQHELDELYKEIHVLKKRMRTYEKKR